MRKAHVILASAALFVGVTVALAASDHHVKAPLQPFNGSGITGFAELSQLPKGGANLVVSMRGLTAGASYASFYYESSDCTAPAELFVSFTADKDGRATVHGRIDEDVDEVGSVSVRVGPGYGALLACARMH